MWYFLPVYTMLIFSWRWCWCWSCGTWLAFEYTLGTGTSSYIGRKRQWSYSVVWISGTFSIRSCPIPLVNWIVIIWLLEFFSVCVVCSEITWETTWDLLLPRYCSCRICHLRRWFWNLSWQNGNKKYENIFEQRLHWWLGRVWATHECFRFLTIFLGTFYSVQKRSPCTNVTQKCWNEHGGWQLRKLRKTKNCILSGGDL